MKRFVAFWAEVGLILSLAWGLSCYLLRHEVPARGAPAPLPRQTPRKLQPAGLVGEWVMSWGGDDWHVSLRPDGTYLCTLGGSKWTGTWLIDAMGNLCVDERLRGGGCRWQWYVPTSKGKVKGDALGPDGRHRARVELRRAE